MATSLFAGGWCNTRKRGLMNPATKQYPRPILPLLCKWFKQREQRQLFKSWCRLKILATATTEKEIFWEVWGEQ
jgi:hypothetical protein